MLPHIPDFWRYTDQVTAVWQDGEVRDMLVEMRKLALLILVGATFKVDFTPDMARNVAADPRPAGVHFAWFMDYLAGAPAKAKHKRAAQIMNDYLHDIIRRRRTELAVSGAEPEAGDLLGKLIAAPNMTDDLIRDQLLTMLIVGHDTSTALLAWVLYLLGAHQDARQAVVAEIDAVIGGSDEPPAVDQVNRLDDRPGNQRDAAPLPADSHGQPADAAGRWAVRLPCGRGAIW